MALVVKDRVRVSSVTSGTGPLTLGAAITGFQDFSVIGNGNTTYYTIVDPTTGDWEVGLGTYSSTGPSLARNTILESSNGGTAVNFLSNPKDVFVTYPAERSVYVDGTAIVPAEAARLGFANLTQGSALSVLGVTGNATANVASIAAASDHQVLRRSGTAVAFGAVALNQANAVTGTLPVGNGGTGVTSSTGTGSVVLSTSPSLVTPALGTPTSGNFSTGTFTWPTFNQNTTGTAAISTTATVTTSATASAFKVPFANTTVSTTGNYGLLQDSEATFTYNPSTNTLTVGTVSGALSGNATTATTLQTARTINGVSFDGSANITITANTPNTLTRGTYLTGANFNGSAATTWAVDATTTNTASKVVARDASGNFSAGTITAALSGNATTATTATNATNVTVTTSATSSAFKVPFANTTVSTTGNYGLLQDSAAEFTYNPSTNVLTVGTVSGALSGNAATATTLQTARTINGTSFDGSANITTASWGTARTINGSSIDGSANVTTANWGTARTIWGQSIDGSANITAPVLPAAGSAAAPAFSTSGDTNTGMYFPAADQVGVSAGGTVRLTVTTAQFTATLPWRGQNGTAAAPAFSASADTNTGIYFPAADTIAIVEGGTEVIRVNSASNVGVGNTAPTEKLDVTGSVKGTQVISGNGIFVNSAAITANYTVPTGSNAMSAGPITVNSGVTVTVSAGSVWTVV
jgi:hypothetical protein